MKNASWLTIVEVRRTTSTHQTRKDKPTQVYSWAIQIRKRLVYSGNGWMRREHKFPRSFIRKPPLSKHGVPFVVLSHFALVNRTSWDRVWTPEKVLGKTKIKVPFDIYQFKIPFQPLQCLYPLAFALLDR